MRLPVRLRWIVLTVLAVWVGGGLVFQSPRNGDVDPVEAAKPRYVAENNLELILTADGPSDMIGCLQNCWFSGSSDAKVVLYQDTTDEDDRYYFGLLGQYGNEWYRTGEQSLTLENPADRDRVISVMTSRFPEGHSWIYRWGIVQDYSVTVGKVDPEHVSRVTLRHDTGEITSPVLIGNYFVSFAAAPGVCEAHAFDHSGDVIETLDHRDGAGFGHVGQSGVMQPCD